MDKAEKLSYLSLATIAIVTIAIVVPLKIRLIEINDGIDKNRERIENINESIDEIDKDIEDLMGKENVVMNFTGDLKRLHKIGRIEYNINSGLLKIWNPIEGSAVWDVKVSVDNGPISLYSPKVISRLKKVGDNYVKIKGDLIGLESNIFKPNLYEKYPYYYSFVFEIPNANRVVVDDYAFDEPGSTRWWDSMDKVVINL